MHHRQSADRGVETGKWLQLKLIQEEIEFRQKVECKVTFSTFCMPACSHSIPPGRPPARPHVHEHTHTRARTHTQCLQSSMNKALACCGALALHPPCVSAHESTCGDSFVDTFVWTYAPSCCSRQALIL